MIYTPQGLSLVETIRGTRGATAARYDVHVDGLPTIGVDLARVRPESPERVIVAFPGARGLRWWSDECPATYTADSLPPDVAFVDVRWASSWFDAPTGQPAGPAGMAARAAAVIGFVRDVFPDVPLSIIGASAGATAAVSVAAFYDPDHAVRDLVLCSGPLIGITEMCMAPGWLKLGARFVDESFGEGGWFGGSCRRRDASMADEWDENDAGKSEGIDFAQTAVTHIRGTKAKLLFPGGERVDAWLAGRGTSVVLEGVGHVIHETEAGMRAIRTALGC